LKRTFYFLFIFLAVFIPSPAAQEITYDRYAALWPEGSMEEKSSLQSFSRHFLVYPFELARWPVDKTLLFVEKYHVDDKVDWIYEQLKNRGVTPKVRLLTDDFGGGLEIEFIQLTGLKERFPNSTFRTSGFWTADHITDYKVELKQEKIAGTGFFSAGNFRYENRGEEHFYGIGPNTSLGDGTSYRMERTTLALPVGYEFSDSLKAEGKVSYQNVNITNGEDGGRGIIDEIFVATGRQPIPGLGGDEILSWGLDLEHDTRDSDELPLRGGYERAHFSYNKGMDSSTGFFKYRGEAAHFFRLFSDRRVLAVRGLVEHNDEAGDREVPFFQMARLGGFGTYPRLGDLHRGFRRDRFYDESLILLNIEYRWTVWEYREWRGDAILFWDEGQVFGEWTDFQFKDFEPSYGVGLRISLEGEVLLSIETAKSHEGTQFYVKTRAPF